MLKYIFSPTKFAPSLCRHLSSRSHASTFVTFISSLTFEVLSLTKELQYCRIFRVRIVSTRSLIQFMLYSKQLYNMRVCLELCTNVQLYNRQTLYSCSIDTEEQREAPNVLAITLTTFLRRGPGANCMRLLLDPNSCCRCIVKGLVLHYKEPLSY